MDRKLNLKLVLQQMKEELASNKNNSSEILRKARTYIHQEKTKIKEEHKLTYHLTGEVGWINDPNGFSYYNGKYHLFYQYHPFDTKWGSMHWGHAVTQDFVKWEYLPVALAPDEIYDMDGCFSGGALQVEDLHILMYTGNKNALTHQIEMNRQVQCIAIGDGNTYIKAKSNSVIGTFQIPQNSSLADFRDPKIWRKENVFYVVIGSRHDDGSGQILLYSSHNLLDWDYVGTLLRSENKLGLMWECPDVFELDGKDILIMSPQEMQREEHRFHNGYGTTYMIGELDYLTGRYTYDYYDEIDYGLDFYAPQTLKTPDGRIIMIAWMQTWERNIPTDKLGWAGAMTLPRELHIKGNKLIQLPIKEIKRYRQNSIKHEQVNIQGQVELDNVCGRQIELEIEADLKETAQFEINLMKNNMACTKVIYNAKKQVLIFDRTESQSGINGLNIRTMPVILHQNKLKLRIFIDKFSVEIFVNDGDGTMTSTVYTQIEAQGISFASDKSVLMNINKWDLIIE